MEFVRAGQGGSRRRYHDNGPRPLLGYAIIRFYVRNINAISKMLKRRDHNRLIKKDI